MIKNSQIFSLDDSTFENFLQTGGDELLVIDFWAEWCSPCKVFSPIFEEVAVEYDKQVKFGKFNIDGNSIIVEKYNIRSIPTLLLFKTGVMLSSKIGILSKKQLQELLKSYL